MTELAHDLIPSHVADILVQKQEALNQHHHDVNDETTTLSQNKSPRQSLSRQVSSRGRQSDVISGVGAVAEPAGMGGNRDPLLPGSDSALITDLRKPKGIFSRCSTSHRGSLLDVPRPVQEQEGLDESDEFSVLPPAASSRGISGLLRRMDMGSLIGRPTSASSLTEGGLSSRATSAEFAASSSYTMPSMAQNEAIAFSHDNVTILFAGLTLPPCSDLVASQSSFKLSEFSLLSSCILIADIVKFTDLSSRVTPAEVNDELPFVDDTQCMCISPNPITE